MFQGFHLVIGDRLNATRWETALWKMDKIDIGSGRDDLLYWGRCTVVNIVSGRCITEVVTRKVLVSKHSQPFRSFE